MNKDELQNRAKTTAAWPYTVRISKDETVDGQIVFLATHPELPGCMAQGKDVEEAMANLKEVTFEYILSLLEDRIPIPMPSGRTKTTTSYSISNTTIGNKSFLDILSEAVQPCTREELSTVELVN
jgi:predicted RNase H-like HicB family nuclease